MKIGDYVRTKTGLGKITEYKKHDSWGYIVKVEGTYNCYTHTENGELSDVIKSSPNIIDLIEVGDYVNGMIVNDIVDNRFNLVGYFDNWLEEKDIKSIVTKEQFESMEYKVGE